MIKNISENILPSFNSNLYTKIFTSDLITSSRDSVNCLNLVSITASINYLVDSANLELNENSRESINGYSIFVSSIILKNIILNEQCNFCSKLNF